MDEESGGQIRMGIGMAYETIWGISLSPGYNNRSVKGWWNGISNAGDERK